MRISSRQYLEATSQLSINDDTSQNELFAKLGARKCFRDADANKDQVISQDEVTLSAEAFARLDASKDGKVTQEEISAAMAGHGKEVYSYYVSKRGGSNSLELLSTILGDSTKQDDDSAYEKAAKQYLTRKDANKDGVLSRTETPMAASTFTNIDTSGNGTIELSEMQAALKIHDTKLSTYFSSLSESSSQSTLQKKI
jgi:Ca2+-binding EF-hand superfamily protein